MLEIEPELCTNGVHFIIYMRTVDWIGEEFWPYLLQLGIWDEVRGNWELHHSICC
jgi:hypothetical protein